MRTASPTRPRRTACTHGARAPTTATATSATLTTRSVRTTPTPRAPSVCRRVTTSMTRTRTPAARTPTADSEPHVKAGARAARAGVKGRAGPGLGRGVARRLVPPAKGEAGRRARAAAGGAGGACGIDRVSAASLPRAAASSAAGQVIGGRLLAGGRPPCSVSGCALWLLGLLTMRWRQKPGGNEPPQPMACSLGTQACFWLVFAAPVN